MAGLHPHELHARDYAGQRRPVRGDPEHVDGARARARAPRSPLPTASDGDLPRPARRVGELHAAGEEGRQRRGVRAARAVRGAVRVTRPLDPHRARRLDEQVGAVVGVAAGDDHRAGRRARAAPRRARRCPAPSPSPDSARASGRFGVTTVARGRIRSISAAFAVGSSSVAPLSAIITGSTTTGASPTSSRRVEHRVDRRLVGEHPDLDRVDADVRRDRVDLGDDHLRRDGGDHLDPDRVLRGQRGDRRRPVDAAASERLQVGLDPGAAAGVRAGDRQAGGDSVHLSVITLEGIHGRRRSVSPRTRRAGRARDVAEQLQPRQRHGAPRAARGPPSSASRSTVPDPPPTRSRTAASRGSSGGPGRLAGAARVAPAPPPTP